jgi:polyisoprenoid-binding protein YceI
VKTSGDNTTADAKGILTIKGIAKEMTAPVKLTYLKGKLGQRVPNLKGDLLVIRSTFKIKRSDFGINPGAPTDKVADEIELSLSVAGASAQQLAAK